MTTYAGNPLNYPSAVTMPDGSNPAAAISAAFEGDLDRTAFLKAAITALADIAALKAIDTTSAGNYPTGTLRLVTGKGFYLLDRALASTEVQPHLITPTAGVGRWKLLSAKSTTRSIFVPFAVRSLAAGWGYDVYGELLGPASATGQFLNFPPGSLHDGATLSSVVLVMKAEQTHASLPATPVSMLAFRIPRTANNGGDTLVSMASGGATTASFANVAAYKNTDRIVEVTHTLDQNNVIDLASYEYLLSIEDEQGAGAVAGNKFYGARLNFTSLLPAGWP